MEDFASLKKGIRINNMNDKNWFVHVEWVVVLVTLLGGFYLLDGKIERQGARTDRLYEMYVDTQKEIKQMYINRLGEK
jgi:hypothetical protein